VTQEPQRDTRVLEGFGLDDLDAISIGAFRERFAASKPKHPWLALDDKALLEQLGCWQKQRQTGVQGLTLAGLLMFGRHEAIISPGAAPNYFVDFRDFRGQQNPGDPWSDRLFPDGTWEANLFQFCLQCWPKLTGDLALARPSNSGQPVDQSPVHTALREALVNALVHTDYDVPGGIVFERYRERIVMENPGSLLVSPEQLSRGGVSLCRNRSLQRMFMLIGACDQAGAGYKRINEGWWSQLWPEPRLSVQEQPRRVRLEFIMRSRISVQNHQVESRRRRS
jgi:predicted HTH transcriptional regulator